MARRWTGIAELDSVLAELVDMVHRVLGDDLVGVYLQGSFALGGADEESDCDFLVVSSVPLDAARLDAVRAFHAELPHRPGYWNAHLEGSYPLVADLSDLSTVGRQWPYVDHGSDQVVIDAHCNTEVARWILYEHGITLSGPDPRTFTATVPSEVLRAAAETALVRAVAEWEQFGCWDAWSQRYAVVTLPRMLRTFLIGDVLSKPAAVAWATQVLHPRWRPLLKAAFADRGQRPWDAPVNDRLVASTLDFVRYVGRVAATAGQQDRPEQSARWGGAD